MKYGSLAGTSSNNNNGGDTGNIYEHGVIAGTTIGIGMFGGGNQMNVNAMTSTAQQQLQQQQQSSVIKTAPRAIHNNNNNVPPMLLDFSPKQEPIDLAPLSANGTHLCLQDLGKMSVGNATQLEHYYSTMSNNNSMTAAKNANYSSVNPYYEYLDPAAASYHHHPTQSVPSASNSTLLQPSTAATVVALGTNVQQHMMQHQDWPYVSYNVPQHHLQQHHQQHQLSYLGQMDNCSAVQLGGLLDTHPHRTLYKNGTGMNGIVGLDNLAVGMLSPVDSGIGQELLLEQAKQQLQEFFGPSLSSTGVLVSTEQSNGQHQSSVVQQHHDQELCFSETLNSQQKQQRQRREQNRSVESPQQDQHSNQQQQQLHELREQSIPVVIPKLNNLLGFQYTLEAPISTSIRKEDDRMTYVNKGQFYTISLDYLPDLLHPLKGMSVRSQVMVIFREDKSYDDELRTWLVWYKRQHSPKQRIIELDTKNSMGIEDFNNIAHNVVQFRWNPTEQPGPKVNIAVHCLSTDFSTQKGVKGLPLHIQIDTYDDQNDSKLPFHRGYCQIKVFCDKGAERKLRDEDKRAHRRKNNTDKGTSPPPTAMSNHHNQQQHCSSSSTPSGSGSRKKSDGEFHEPSERSPFYHAADLERPAALFLPPDDVFFDTVSIGSYDALSELEPQPKRPRTSERIMIYVRKADEEIFTPLHLVPPTLCGLARAISEKYNLDESKIEAFYKQCQKGGVTVKIDDDMLRHYTNQDTFLLEFKQSELDRHIFYTVTLVELLTANNTHNNMTNENLFNGGNDINSLIVGSTTTVHHHSQHLNMHNHQSQTPSATSSSSTTSEPPSASSTTMVMAATSANGQQQQRIAPVW